jgi:hypothetical protein
MIARDFQGQKEALTSKENLLKLRKAGVTDFDAYVKDQRHLLDLKEKAALEAAATEAKAAGLRSGNPGAQARSNALSAQLAQSAAVQRQGLEKSIAESEYARAHARQLDARAKALRSGGGGSSGALSAISQYIKDHPDDQPGAYAMAERLGFRGAKGAALVDKLQNDFKAGKAAAAENEENTVRAEKNDPSGLPANSVLGHVPKGKGGAPAFASRDAEYGRAIGQLEELLHDIDTNGERVFTPGNIKRRNTLFHNAVIGVGTVSPLGKTDSALHEEEGSIGGTGGAWSPKGADREAVARKVEELKDQRMRYRQQTLIPDKGRPIEEAPRAESHAPKVEAPKVPDRLSLAQQALNDPEATDAEKMQARRILFEAKKAQK